LGLRQTDRHDEIDIHTDKDTDVSRLKILTCIPTDWYGDWGATHKS